jgi:hypothetical protein
MGRQIKLAFPLDRAAFVAYIFSRQVCVRPVQFDANSNESPARQRRVFCFLMALLKIVAALSSVTPLNEVATLFTGPISRANAHSFQRN